MEIYATESVGNLDSDDKIVYTNEEGADDVIELDTKIDSGDSILLKGYSHISGDNVTYILNADVEVGLWRV